MASTKRLTSVKNFVMLQQDYAVSTPPANR